MPDLQLSPVPVPVATIAPPLPYDPEGAISIGALIVILVGFLYLGVTDRQKTAF